MGSCAAPSAKGDDKFITTDYLQQCRSACVRSALTLEIFNLLPITIAILHLNMQELSLSGQQPSSGIPLPIHVLLEF
ncbi:hypothetical protein AIY93_23020 [Salmonella enterica subsp. enterica serovar Typhimurium]|nr:hypothetical protein AIY93_23020 [Salmonella enterica subsp. enterica serovar Typhimurium]